MRKLGSSSVGCDSFGSAAGKGKKRCRDEYVEVGSANGKATDANGPKQGYGANVLLEAAADNEMTRNMLIQLMENEGINEKGAVGDVLTIREHDDEEKYEGLFGEDSGLNAIFGFNEQPALLEWDDWGWNPSWVFEEKSSLLGSWNWDWIWYPYWDLMVDNWAFDDGDNILWDDDVWSPKDIAESFLKDDVKETPKL